MIHSVQIDGFRSLDGFSLNFSPGLNILVGPNGSGKTNVIEFFQLVSQLSRKNIKDAISLAGGVGSVFRKLSQSEYKKSVSATIRGATYSNHKYILKKSGTIVYEFSFEISAANGFEEIEYVYQEVKIKFISPKNIANKPYEFTDPSWDLEFKFSNYDQNLKIGVTENEHSPYTIHLREASLLKAAMDNYALQEKELRRFSSYCILSIIDEAPINWIIRGDIDRGEIINIDPRQLRKSEDIGARPGIQSDGSGLAATLNYLQRDDHRASSVPFYFDASDIRILPNRPDDGWKATLNQIKGLATLVNNQIEDVFVETEHFENYLRLKLRLKGELGNFDLPASALSDGTLKWLSLVTAILTHRSMFAIEEPENFLHPHMQKEVIKLMRETTKEKKSFALMSTHSETILNASIASEIIVVKATDSITSARRISDPKFLDKEIKATGFGMGSYYIAGDLNDA
ncbi:AAA family ATPase [Plastoroseomonas arctica]|uniref:AAA family ATPase n=1 Tax=Plastoroseomonas arctica TaxID=1509237 RepID=A0AAF1K4V2_9PROT|nr:AAA family ATPase [Plastoroseomonas arctica]MBR0656256.1 AAA family ATPase [Plastoroseomonas arctica]